MTRGFACRIEDLGIEDFQLSADIRPISTKQRKSRRIGRPEERSPNPLQTQVKVQMTKTQPVIGKITKNQCRANQRITTEQIRAE